MKKITLEIFCCIFLLALLLMNKTTIYALGTERITIIPKEIDRDTPQNDNDNIIRPIFSNFLKFYTGENTLRRILNPKNEDKENLIRIRGNYSENLNGISEAPWLAVLNNGKIEADKIPNIDEIKSLYSDFKLEFLGWHFYSEKEKSYIKITENLEDMTFNEGDKVYAVWEYEDNNIELKLAPVYYEEGQAYTNISWIYPKENLNIKILGTSSDGSRFLETDYQNNSKINIEKFNLLNIAVLSPDNSVILIKKNIALELIPLFSKVNNFSGTLEKKDNKESVVLKWDRLKGAVRYKIKRGDEILSEDIRENYFVDDSLKSGSKKIYYVWAYDIFGKCVEENYSYISLEEKNDEKYDYLKFYDEIFENYSIDSKVNIINVTKDLDGFIHSKENPQEVSRIMKSDKNYDLYTVLSNYFYSTSVLDINESSKNESFKTKYSDEDFKNYYFKKDGVEIKYFYTKEALVLTLNEDINNLPKIKFDAEIFEKIQKNILTRINTIIVQFGEYNVYINAYKLTALLNKYRDEEKSLKGLFFNIGFLKSESFVTSEQNKKILEGIKESIITENIVINPNDESGKTHKLIGYIPVFDLFDETDGRVSYLNAFEENNYNSALYSSLYLPSYKKLTLDVMLNLSMSRSLKNNFDQKSAMPFSEYIVSQFKEFPEIAEISNLFTSDILESEKSKKEISVSTIKNTLLPKGMTIEVPFVEKPMSDEDFWLLVLDTIGKEPPEQEIGPIKEVEVEGNFEPMDEYEEFVQKVEYFYRPYTLQRVEEHFTEEDKDKERNTVEQIFDAVFDMIGNLLNL